MNIINIKNEYDLNIFYKHVKIVFNYKKESFVKHSLTTAGEIYIFST